MKLRSSLVTGALAGLLALGAVACEVDDMDMDDPLEEDDTFGEDAEE